MVIRLNWDDLNVDDDLVFSKASKVLDDSDDMEEVEVFTCDVCRVKDNQWLSVAHVASTTGGSTTVVFLAQDE